MPNGEIRASDKDKKRLQRLNNSLAAFCHTPELGIRLTADGSTYQCRFKITPETHCTEHHPTKNIKHF